ncbi:MAG TPA: VOC family protein [Jiangellaceae bacterium]|nr:VOC family protein [Jiangellaceae bacterium]
MSLATWQALCMDASDQARLAGFWAAVIGLTPVDAGDGSVRLDGERRDQQIWVDPVPEPKTVKHRVHLDVDVGDLSGLEELGATVVIPPGDDRTWWVMADVEGGEFCAFVRDGLPSLPGRLYEVVVDCTDAYAQALWWGEVLGLPSEASPKEPDAALEGGDVLPFDFLCFAPVPEPKRAKNRIHWDVETPDVDALVDRGARVLRAPDDEISWHVLADPEGNEFCAFTPS